MGRHGGGEFEQPDPSLVTDEPKHRDLIRHGETGFVYRSEEEALSLLTLLLDDGRLRRQIGEAARADASLRFADGRLRQAIQSAYNFHPGRLLQVGTGPSPLSGSGT